MSHRAQAPLVGRDAEVGVLDRVLDDLWAGGSAALVVTGEPGIGKTRLLEELGLRAADRGAVVVSGRAAEYEVDLPLAVWIDALEPHVAATGAPDLSERDAASLAEALPSLAHDPGATVPERHRVHAAMRSLLAALAEDRPLVVVLDDLHWADSGVRRPHRSAAAPPARGRGPPRALVAPAPGSGASGGRVRPCAA